MGVNVLIVVRFGRRLLIICLCLGVLDFGLAF